MSVLNFGHQEHYQVRAYDIDAHKRMTAPALLRVLNEAAMQHVVELKLSVWDLEAHDIGWVLLRLEISIERLPVLGEQIRIITTPSGFERAYTYRDYRVLDADDNILATASTTWILLNTKNRRPTRIPLWIQERMPEMPGPEDCLPRPAAQLGAWTNAQYQRQNRVGWYDLDFNWHLSNTHYLGLLFDSIPSDFLRAHHPTRISIHYKQEAQVDDVLQSETAGVDSLDCLHRLMRGDTILADGASTWRAIES